MILVSKTYERVTEESSENGEAEETGFVFENEPFSFRELVSELKNYAHASSYPCNGSRYDWTTTESFMYYKGASTSYSLHFSHKNVPLSEKYWRKALQISGLAQTM